MPHDVFICHSARDKAAADAVCATLESKKIRCWIAPRDAPPGQSWAGALVRAISESRVFVLVFSASANSSPQVMREVERAVNREIPIIPFRIEDVQPSEDIGYFIESIHWLDAFTPPLERHAQKLADTVQRLLTAEGEPQPPVVTPKPPPAVVPKPPSVRLAPPHPWPTWAIPVIALIVLFIAVMVLLNVVGGGWWAVTKLQTKPTATSTPTPTDTPTMTPTPIPTSTPMPTDTPTVTPTPTITPNPTSTATATPRTPTATATPRTPTATATPRRRTVTPTSVPRAAQPEPVAPAQGREYQSPITLQWRGSLSAGQAYQVTAFHPESGHTIQSGLLTDQSWTADLPADKYGEWRWTVSVVQGGRAVTTSSEWMFWFVPFPGRSPEPFPTRD